MRMGIHNIDRIGLVLIILVAALSGYWAVNRIAKTHTLVRQENDLLSKRLQELDLANTSMHQLKGVLDEVRGELRELNEAIPPSAEIGKLLKQMDDLIRARQIRMLSLQPKPAVKVKQFNKIPVHMVLEGRFVDLFHLLHDFENMSRTMVMEKLKITKVKPDEPLCKADLLASVFEK